MKKNQYPKVEKLKIRLEKQYLQFSSERSFELK